MTSDWKESAIKYRDYRADKSTGYDDDEIPYKKKKTKKKIQRSKHKHTYAEGIANHINEQGQHAWYSIIKYCTICGKIYDEKVFMTEADIADLRKKGARTFDIEGCESLFLTSKYVSI